MIIKMLLITFLISSNLLFAANKKNSFDDMLSLLKEKEKLEENNNKLENTITKLKQQLSENNNKYQELSKKFNNIEKTKKEKDLKDNELITNEIKGRLPIPYIILNYDNEKIAKILKLNWYYVFNSDGTTVFNGRYLSDKLKINDKYLTYFVKNIKSDYINYCLIKNKNQCIKKYLINSDIYKSMKSIEIKDGIPDELLTNKDNFQDILSKILSKTNPLTKRITSETEETENSISDSLDNLVNPKVNDKPTGVNIPKNNISEFKMPKEHK